MLLVYPPSARSPEPPLGIARLAALLRSRGLEASCLDLNQEGIDWLLARERGIAAEEGDTWTRLALRRRGRDLERLREPATYAIPDRYRNAVLDLNRALRAASAPAGVEAGLADYRDPARSPLRRADLLDSAARHRDNLFFPLFAERIAAALGGGGEETVGISVVYLSQALTAFAIAGYLRADYPGIRLVMGGGLISSWSAQGSLRPGETFGGLVDAFLPGRAEDALEAWLALGGGLDAGRDSGGAGLLTAGPRPVGPLPVGPAPDYDDFAGLRYSAPARIVPYNFSTGCPWKRCSFCPERAEDAPYRPVRSPRAMAELRGLVERYGAGLLHLTDNEVAPLYLRALAAEPPGAPWYGFARFSPLLEDPAFCRRLAASGCVTLQLGLESGSQAVLDALGKGTNLEGIDRSLEALAEAGIAVYLYVLLGTPAEDRRAAFATRDFLAARAGRIAFLNVALFNLPATSPEAALLSTRRFYDGDMSLYSEFSHPEGWNRDSVRRFVAEELEGTPEIAAIIKRNPPVFSSNHAPFFARNLGLRSLPARSTW